MGLTDTLPGKFNPRDEYSGNIRTIDPVHSVIHLGVHFTADHFVTVGTVTAVSVLITPPAAGSGRYIHFIAGFQSNNSGVLTFSENPNASGGTTLTSANNNRLTKIEKPDPVVLKHSITFTSSGTVLENIIVAGASTNQAVIGGNGVQRNEWILEGGSTYLLRFVADNASTRAVIKCEYYYRDAE